MNAVRLKQWVVILTLGFALLASIGFVGTQPLEAQEPELKIGLIYVGPVGDYGWSWSHDQGRKAIEQEFGDRVQTVTAEAVAEVDARNVMEGMIQNGADLIIGTSFGFWNPLVELSEQYPDVAFMNCAGNYAVEENAGTCFGNMYEGQYLQGIVAGHQTESDILGYVAPHPVPAVFQDVNAFTLGAQSVNSDVEVRVVWTNSWHDPATEREAAMSVIDVGADVVAHHQDSPAVPKAAAERGVYSFGYHWQHGRQAPEAVLMSTYWDWSQIYVPIARSVLDGTWEPQMYIGGMEDGLVKVTDLSDLVKSGIQEQYREARQELEEGTLEPFSGPIHNQDGELMVEEGESLSTDQIHTLNWFVEGVVGEAPN